jgi:hypothetical protein
MKGAWISRLARVFVPKKGKENRGLQKFKNFDGRGDISPFAHTRGMQIPNVDNKVGEGYKYKKIRGAGS